MCNPNNHLTGFLSISRARARKVSRDARAKWKYLKREEMRGRGNYIITKMKRAIIVNQKQSSQTQAAGVFIKSNKLPIGTSFESIEISFTIELLFATTVESSSLFFWR